MSGSNLTLDGEIRYIIQWFNEWSELQREDFVPVFVEYLKMNEGYVNGLVAGMDNASCADKPMSLFQCRVSEETEGMRKIQSLTNLRLNCLLPGETVPGVVEEVARGNQGAPEGEADGAGQWHHGEDRGGAQVVGERPRTYDQWGRSSRGIARRGQRSRASDHD